MDTNSLEKIRVDFYQPLRMSKGHPVGVQEREYVSCVLSTSVVLTVKMTSLVFAVNASSDTIP